jgi:hypothetical protein
MHAAHVSCLEKVSWRSAASTNVYHVVGRCSGVCGKPIYQSLAVPLSWPVIHTFLCTVLFRAVHAWSWNSSAYRTPRAGSFVCWMERWCCMLARIVAVHSSPPILVCFYCLLSESASSCMTASPQSHAVPSQGELALCMVSCASTPLAFASAAGLLHGRLSHGSLHPQFTFSVSD